VWLKRLRRQIAAIVLGGALGAFIHILIEPSHLPVMGFVIGGLLFFGLNEAVQAE
jgi:hypothetical protein